MISRLLHSLATKEYRSSKCQTKSGGSIQGDQKAVYTACQQHSQKGERKRNHWTGWAKRTAVSAHTAAAREARVAIGKNGFCLIMSCQRRESHGDTARAVRRWNGTGQLVGRRWNGTRQLVGRRWNGTGQLVGRWWNGTRQLVGRRWNGTGQLVGRWWNGTRQLVGRRWDGTGQLVGRWLNGTRQLVGRRWNGTGQQVGRWWNGNTPTSWETMRWDTPTRVVRRRNRTRQQELWGGGMGHATRAMRWLHGAGAPQVGNDQGWHQIGRKAYGSGGGGYVYGGMGIRQICDMESDKIMVIWCCKYSSAVWQELWL